VAFHIVWLSKLGVEDVMRGASASIIPVIENWALEAVCEQIYPTGQIANRPVLLHFLLTLFVNPPTVCFI
ncbi:hypothetical protein NL478_28345, partial [Klebsiella pneumoniae]|nr:hypothetical protein [Klebsiella pneumoniae]